MREISAVIFQGKPRCGAFFNEETWHMDFFLARSYAAGRLLSEPMRGP